MCIAIVKRKNISLPKEEHLYNCFKNNPHGAGFSVNRNGVNFIYKGFMTFEEFLDKFYKVNIKEDESALIHFRVASVGKIKKENCHPFPATQNFSCMRNPYYQTNEPIVVHNGTFYNFYEDNQGNSDTMQFVNMISPILNTMSKFNKNQRTAFMKLLNECVQTNFSRFAVMNNKGQIHCFGDWIKDEETGLMYSNKSYTHVTDRFKHIQLEFNFTY